MPDVVSPPGLHRYAVIELLPVAVAFAVTEEPVVAHVNVSEEVTFTVGVLKSDTTVALAEAVQPLLWVTVTV